MNRVSTTLRQWCPICLRATFSIPCPLGCGAQACSGCLDHGPGGCSEAAEDD